MDGSEQLSSRSRRVALKQDAAQAFSSIGLIGIGLGLVTLVFGSLPVRLMDPAWQLQLSASFTTAGFSLLIGTLLVCTAEAFPVASEVPANRMPWVRKLCTWVAILYLVLIPVQIYAGVKVLRQAASDDGRTQAEWLKFKRQMQATTNAQELGALLGKLRQPITLPPKLDAPFAVVKQRIIDRADARFKALAYESEQARSKRLEGFIGEAAANSLNSLLYAAGFAACAQSKPGAPSLLEQILVRIGLMRPRRGGSW